MTILGTEVPALLERAAALAARAHVPHSGQRCGAVLVAADGQVFAGAAVEVGSAASSVCAPKVALVSAVTAGVRDFVAVVVAGTGADLPYLCGDCRESYAGFSPGLTVVSSAHPAAPRSLESLLPLSP